LENLLSKFQLFARELPEAKKHRLKDVNQVEVLNLGDHGENKTKLNAIP